LEFPSYPAYPTNGGDLLTAPPKIGTWAWQPKIDDWHGIIHAPTRRIWNQYGKPSSIEGKFRVAMERLRPTQYFKWLDVGLMQCRHDMMRGCIVVFDFIPTDGLCLAYIDRRKLLEPLFEILPMATDLLKDGACTNRVFLINHFVVCDAIILYQTLKVQNALLGKKFYEGVVAKRMDKPYPLSTKPKDATPWMIKHRFDQLN
jgi:hypothetical protein